MLQVETRSSLRRDEDSAAGRFAHTAAAVMNPKFERSLLDEIEAALGDDHRQAAENRLGRIEEMLRPTVAALPKNEHGKLNSAAARYALHRLFVERHGWFVRGVEPAGASWNSSSVTSVLQDRVPEHVQDLFEQRLGNQGFGLHEVAVLAAILEHLVHNESMERLQNTYAALELPTNGVVEEQDAEHAIDAYMAIYIMGLNVSAMEPTQVRNEVAGASKTYPNWRETQVFLREVRGSVAPEAGPLSYQKVAAVVEEVGERYGRWQAAECRSFKGQLVEMEDAGTGRVRLGDFYQSALNEGNWQFSESLEYLRELGAVDESDPMVPRVIIPNYINSPSNCIAPSEYHAVCCLDECEELIGHLERTLAAPTATPSELANLVALLPSATVAANRTLSAGLLSRLEEVGTHHHGQVPLHGRLFLQWMHHVYPRECPYPHIAGATNPRRAEQFYKETGRDVTATEEEMRQHVEIALPQEIIDPEAPVDVQWTMHEEILGHHVGEASNEQTSSGAGTALRSFTWLMTLGFVSGVLAKSLSRCQDAMEDVRAGGSLSFAAKKTHLV